MGGDYLGRRILGGAGGGGGRKLLTHVGRTREVLSSEDVTKRTQGTRSKKTARGDCSKVVAHHHTLGGPRGCSGCRVILPARRRMFAHREAQGRVMDQLMVLNPGALVDEGRVVRVGSAQ